jgi:hypothetical protein
MVPWSRGLHSIDSGCVFISACQFPWELVGTWLERAVVMQIIHLARLVDIILLNTKHVYIQTIIIRIFLKWINGFISDFFQEQFFFAAVFHID